MLSGNNHETSLKQLLSAGANDLVLTHVAKLNCVRPTATPPVSAPPKPNVYLSLRTPLAQESAATRCCCDLLTDALNPT